MKIIYKIILSFQLITLLFSYSDLTAQSDLEKIKSVMKMQEDAWNRGDILSFMEGYWKSDSLLFIGSNGIYRGWEATLKRYQHSYPTKEKMGTLRFELDQIELLNKDRAHVIGQYYLSNVNGEVFSNGYFTLLWKIVNDKWVIMIDQTCG